MVQKLERKQYRKWQKFKKTEFRDLVNLKLLLNRNKLQKIIDMKKMRLDHIFPAAYHWLYSDVRFRKNRENTHAPSCHARTIYETGLKLR